MDRLMLAVIVVIGVGVMVGSAVDLIGEPTSPIAPPVGAITVGGDPLIGGLVSTELIPAVGGPWWLGTEAEVLVVYDGGEDALGFASVRIAYDPASLEFVGATVFDLGPTVKHETRVVDLGRGTVVVVTEFDDFGAAEFPFAAIPCSLTFLPIEVGPTQVQFIAGKSVHYTHDGDDYDDDTGNLIGLTSINVAR